MLNNKVLRLSTARKLRRSSIVFNEKVNVAVEAWFVEQSKFLFFTGLEAGQVRCSKCNQLKKSMLDNKILWLSTFVSFIAKQRIFQTSSYN